MRFKTQDSLCVYCNRQEREVLTKTRARILVEGDDTVETVAAAMSALRVYGTTYDVQFEEVMVGWPAWLADVTTVGDDDDF